MMTQTVRSIIQQLKRAQAQNEIKSFKVAVPMSLNPQNEKAWRSKTTITIFLKRTKTTRAKLEQIEHMFKTTYQCSTVIFTTHNAITVTI